MELKNWWMHSYGKISQFSSLQSNESADVVIIGGGIAGLQAAYYLNKKGKKVILIEKSICGGSSSGKSSGFLTPDSELELYQLIRKFGLKKAREVWSIPKEGVNIILNCIIKNNLFCDLEKQDCFFLGIGKSGIEDVKTEILAHNKLKEPYNSYFGKNINKILKTDYYEAAIRTSQTYGINAFKYTQAMKYFLRKNGVIIYEGSEVKKIKGNTVYTDNGSATGKSIIFAMDKMKKNVSKKSNKIYHAQTFLSISRKLTQKEISNFMPYSKLMCWDSKLVYTYYRLTKDNRILLGGGSPITSYWPTTLNNDLVINNIIKGFKKVFPQLENVEFEYYWPGLIDIAKDLLPIADEDPENKNHYYIQGNPGLPWAAFSGEYIAKKILKENTKNYGKYLGIQRHFFISDILQKFLGKIPSFAINNLYSKYYEKNN